MLGPYLPERRLIPLTPDFLHKNLEWNMISGAPGLFRLRMGAFARMAKTDSVTFCKFQGQQTE
jgi:hypothetical protein